MFAAARRAEELGYGTISMPDHFIPQLAVWPTLAAVAVVAPTVRLGTFVIAADFRHPAVLAKDVATVDVLSDGRVELGSAPAGPATSTRRRAFGGRARASASTASPRWSPS